jgi:hypothetical protein
MASMALPSSLMLLGLPYSLRCRIYVDSGLVINRDLSLTLLPKEPGGVDDQHDLSTSLTLMLICRTVHTETSLLFYSTNRFVLRYRRPDDLRILQNLSPKVLSVLTCLTLQLNVALLPLYWDGHKPLNCPDSNDSLLQLHSSRALLAEWESSADHLARHVRPNTLDFGLICDVTDVETAKSVVAPIYRLPMLKACHVRLNPSFKPDDELQKIAREAGTQAEGNRTSFGFSLLASELRLQILEYTDLVAPLSRVCWVFGHGRDRGYKLPHSWGCSGPCKPPYDVCHPNTHQACPIKRCGLGVGGECPHYASGGLPGKRHMRRCWTCSHYACNFKYCWDLEKRKSHQSQFCFCSRHHAAYSSLCKCWAPPTPLFLVSRTFQRDAQQVFFSKNHFVINVSSKVNGYRVKEIPRPVQYPESVFLRDVVPTTALQHLRSLEFHFLQFWNIPQTDEPLAWHDQHPREHQDWLRTVDIVNGDDCLNPALPSLLLNIHCSRIKGLDSWLESHPDLSAENSNSAIETLKAIAASFWPPLLHSKQCRILYALFSSDYMQAGYYIRPQQPQNSTRIRPRYEPMEFAEQSETSDFTIQRPVIGLGANRENVNNETPLRPLPNTFAQVNGVNGWVEGIWATDSCKL